ncbi:hypothetical protein AVEN_98276-1 [Araneus ventricosus]|uniref:Uncharacterized protein n=1 Tax=Araneus ventricosus TaxID=182803 RepID=A0A4Y2ICL9_ARAVE|nr:hypothetical protein AVEN_98276-1 [Araneus ventricosus]
MNWFLNASTYRAELTVCSKQIAPTMSRLESAHQTVTRWGIGTSKLRSGDSRCPKCANSAYSHTHRNKNGPHRYNRAYWHQIDHCQSSRR